ncbi:hypothetical protein I302_102577 [Kwoniella bestiolae CBS 10118]|uniref:Uncharacterized protein n=1 Tax=Kwoniella bestiolae CBS 10118 TaxID=1296100 RepID=A0A1B9GFM7_9TREE|nr:hypothetical protein I302_01264 [Kwoniella bestiolae CBS 10118]OCF29751.1 hypothetical protein I302_01264 [Kwoniella bestiolae CBS 10118]
MTKRAKLPKPPYALPSKLQHKLKKKRNFPSIKQDLDGPGNDPPHPYKRRRLSTSLDVHSSLPISLLSEKERINLPIIPRLVLTSPTPPPRGPSPATLISVETFEQIFYHLRDGIMKLPLPDLPINLKTPTRHTEDIDNQRLTNEEVSTYKRFLVKRQLNDMSKVCRNWRDRARDTRHGNEVIIIGEDDGHRAFRNPSAWFPLHSTKPLNLTVQVFLPTFIKIINALADIATPININKLTILHSFRQEGRPDELFDQELGDNGKPKYSIEKIDKFLEKIKPRSVHVEWYAGELILTKNCINSIAKTVKRAQWDPEVLEQKLEKGTKVKTRDYDLPYDWDMKNELSTVMTNRMLIVWRDCMVDFALRANHMMILKELRESANFGAIKKFDYHVVTIPLRTVKKQHPLPRPYDSPIPPVGSLRSIDNILMWDLRWRDPKWLRRRNKAAAKQRDESYNWEDHVPDPPIEWTVWGPFDMWKQQKDRKAFKGEGKLIPWKGRQEEIDEAIAQFILLKAEGWVKGYDWIDKSEKENFEDMIHFVVERKHKVKKGPKVFNNNNFLLALHHEGRILDEDLIRSRILEVKSRGNKDLVRAMNEEMAYINAPEWRQEEYNRDYIRVWLTLQSEDEKKMLVEKLRKKYKTKGLYTVMNWALWHPSSPGIKFCVEPRLI